MASLALFSDHHRRKLSQITALPLWLVDKTMNMDKIGEGVDFVLANTQLTLFNMEPRMNGHMRDFFYNGRKYMQKKSAHHSSITDGDDACEHHRMYRSIG